MWLKTGNKCILVKIGQFLYLQDVAAFTVLHLDIIGIFHGTRRDVDHPTGKKINPRHTFKPHLQNAKLMQNIRNFDSSSLAAPLY